MSVADSRASERSAACRPRTIRAESKPGRHAGLRGASSFHASIVQAPFPIEAPWRDDRLDIVVARLPTEPAPLINSAGKR